MIRSHAFSRALRQLQVYLIGVLNWSTGLSVQFLIGQSDNFDLTPDKNSTEKLLYTVKPLLIL